MTRQRVLTELAPVEKSHALVVLGRGFNETFKGLDIVPPRFAIIVEYDEIPLVCSNIKSVPDLIEYVAMTRDGLVYGENIIPICVPKRMTPREVFLQTMRIARGTQQLPPEQLRWLILNYIMGYVDAVVQWGGLKAAKQIANDYRYVNQPGWEPGEEWFYWLEPVELSSEGGMPRA